MSELREGRKAETRAARIMDELSMRLREDRRERGPRTAGAAWVDHPLDDWLEVLRDGKQLPEASMMVLAVGMDQTLAIRDALVDQGVAAERILLEDQSHNTVQNLRYSLALLEQAGIGAEDGILVVSNDFHLARVRMLWNRVCGGDDNLSTLAAPSSHLPSRLKMYLREPLALVKSFLFDR